ncbi:MAG: hypothetical protein R3Y33_07300 [Clostridia bacterium]
MNTNAIQEIRDYYKWHDNLIKLIRPLGHYEKLQKVRPLSDWEKEDYFVCKINDYINHKIVWTFMGDGCGGFSELFYADSENELLEIIQEDILGD